MIVMQLFLCRTSLHQFQQSRRP